MSFLLTVLGVLLLLASLAGVAFGLFMAFDPRTREPGLYFALWWTPAAATAAGILMRDPATFTIGAICFFIAGIAFALERRGSLQRPVRRDKRTRPRDAGKRSPVKETQHRPSGTEKPRFPEATMRQVSGIAKHGSKMAKQLLEEAKRWRSARTRK